MNRYKLEVASMDRRHRLIWRAASLTGSALLVAAALWSAGLPPAQWWRHAGDWLGWDATHQADPARDQTDPSIFPQPGAVPDATVSAARTLPGTDSSVSATPQPLFLVSVSPGRTAADGTARIGTSPDNPQTYVAGAMLANGARLLEVHGDHVVLERSGQRLELYVSADGASSLARRSKGLGEIGLVGGATASPAPAIAASKGTLAEVLRTSVYFENDAFIGLQVFAGRRAWVFSQLGLVSADVIVAIDGTPVADPQSANETLQLLAQGVSLVVTVRRKGNTESLRLDGEIVLSALAPSDPAPQPDAFSGVAPTAS